MTEPMNLMSDISMTQETELSGLTLPAEDVFNWLDNPLCFDTLNSDATWTDAVNNNIGTEVHQPFAELPSNASQHFPFHVPLVSATKLSTPSNSSSPTNLDTFEKPAEKASASRRKAVSRKRTRGTPSRVEPAIERSGNDGGYSARVAIETLRTTLPDSHILGPKGNLVDSSLCSKYNCYMLTPLDPEPRNYFGSRMPIGHLEIRLLDPSDAEDQDMVTAWQPGRSTFCRPAGRTIHLIVTSMPEVENTEDLDSGFALIFCCRPNGDSENYRTSQNWATDCLVTFPKHSSSNGKGRARSGADVAFKGNMEHCVDEATGRRFWGVRTSHVKRKAGESQKAIRIQPRSNFGAANKTQVCFVVALFTSNGSLLYHRDGTPCIAQSNAVTFEPVKSEPMVDIMSSLLREMTKLSFEERVDLSTFVTLGQTVRTVLTSPDTASRARVGQIDFTHESRPPTACYLSDFLGPDLRMPTINDEHLPDDFKRRVRAVARTVGWYGAQPDLTDPTPRHLYTLSVNGAAGRYGQIKEAGLEAAGQWLHEIGVTELTVPDVFARSEINGSVMKDRRFLSPWTVTLTNVYPERTLVDKLDPDKVYCLADTIFEADIAIRDRLLPLARLAFCTKLERKELKEYVMQPYIDGFLSRYENVTIDMQAKSLRDRYTVNQPVPHPLLDEEKFHVILHGMHLDYFLYWTRFRNPISVRRLAKRLLEEDELWDPWFFEPGRFVPLSRKP